MGPTVPTFSPPYQTNNLPHNHHQHVVYNSGSGVNGINRPRFAPHSFFLPNPNPNLMVSASSPPRPGFEQIQIGNQQLGVDSVVKLGSLSNSRPDMIFGSFGNNAGGGVGSFNGNLGNRVPNVLDIEFQKNLEINRNNGVGVGVGGGGGGNRWGATPVRRPAPPGFNNGKNKSGGFEQNVGKGKSKTGEGNYGNVSSGRGSGERRLSGQLDNPGLPAGSKVHSVDASDIEESRMVMQGEVGGDRVKREEEEDGKSELVELEGIVDALVLDDESADKEDKKKQKANRDKVQ